MQCIVKENPGFPGRASHRHCADETRFMKKTWKLVEEAQQSVRKGLLETPILLTKSRRAKVRRAVQPIWLRSGEWNFYVIIKTSEDSEWGIYIQGPVERLLGMLLKAVRIKRTDQIKVNLLNFQSNARLE